MTSEKIRQKFLEYFKKQGHKIVPSSSLLSDDPSVLLTTAGVQQFKSYYTGELDPKKDLGTRRVVSIQKCFRTSDIDEVGDETHLTFFEMLGNFSFGDYWKKEAIKWGYEFLTKEMKFSEKRISATYLKGDKESLIELKKYFPANKIKAAGKKDNFWGPTGDEGPCGPTVEFYIDGIEVWNLVFNQYFCQKNKKMVPLDSVGGVLGVDTGMGLERLVAVLNEKKTVFDTDLFVNLMRYFNSAHLNSRDKRVMSDHIRGICFLVSDGILPSNEKAGYVLRRLIRRISTIDRGENFNEAINKVIKSYKDYSKYKFEERFIKSILSIERAKFKQAIVVGARVISRIKWKTPKELGEKLANIHQTFGINLELSIELLEKEGKKISNKSEVKASHDKKFKEHQKISRASAGKKFGGHGLLLDTGELKAGNEKDAKKVARLHTATHLLQQALRDVLGDEVEQKGSDINPDRARFDFSFQRKLDSEETRRVEQIVNDKIKEDLPVNFEELPLEKAKKTGALFLPKSKYPARVKVYYIGKSLKTAYSKEFCGGPHVKCTSEIGKFKISKEKSVSAGIRRIRAIIE